MLRACLLVGGLALADGASAEQVSDSDFWMEVENKDAFTGDYSCFVLSRDDGHLIRRAPTSTTQVQGYVSVDSGMIDGLHDGIADVREKCFSNHRVEEKGRECSRHLNARFRLEYILDGFGDGIDDEPVRWMPFHVDHDNIGETPLTFPIDMQRIVNGGRDKIVFKYRVMVKHPYTLHRHDVSDEVYRSYAMLDDLEAGLDMARECLAKEMSNR